MTTAILRMAAHKKLAAKVEAFAMPKINWKMIFIFGLFTAGVLWALYNFALNELTRGTYLIKSYEKQISDLSRQNRELEVGFAESSFLGQVRAKTQELNFEKTTKVKYIQILDSAIATAKK